MPAAARVASPVAGPPEHDQQRAFAHVQNLAGNIGARLSGTAGEAAALDYIAEQFRSAGYHTESLPFTFTGNVFTPAYVELPDTTIEGIALIGSPSGTVAGPLVDVGLGDVEGIAGRDLTGRIAVADRGVIRFGDKFDNVRAAGAAGLIVVNTAPGLFIGVLGRVVESPAAGVSRTDAPALDAAAAGGTTVTLTVPAGTPGRGTNVFARSAPDATCEILIGGHLDTVPGVPGANDNASGVANVLELARAFAAEGQTDGLCFAAFSGEESGLHGSQALVRVLRERNNLPRAMVNLDVTGAGDGIELIGSDGPVTTALQAADRLEIATRRSQLPENTGSDHQSFAEAGVPVVYFTSGDFGAIHTPNDTVSRIEPELLDRVGDLTKATIEELRSQSTN